MSYPTTTTTSSKEKIFPGWTLPVKVSNEAHGREWDFFFFPPQSHQNVGCFPFYLSNVCSATICVFYFSSPKTPREDKWILSCLLIVSRHKEMYKSAIKLLFLLLSICKGMHSFSISWCLGFWKGKFIFSIFLVHPTNKSVVLRLHKSILNIWKSNCKRQST